VQIDLFTLIAQIINFLILVLLLRRFLYGPIIRTMDERERRIAAELEEAARKEDEAKREARQCHAEKVRLEDSRGEMLTRAQEEAADLKKKMVAEARSEIEENKTRWTRAIEIEKETFLQNLRQRAGEEVYAISRQVITDLANIELERHIIDTFIERLRGLKDSERQEIATAARRTREGAVITTSFPIDRETRHRLVAVVSEQVAGDIEIRFDTSADLICGIELRAAGKKAAWSMQNYLETLDEKLGLAFSGVREEI
jgi:F-type H+-transporting ATPase subunit b